MTEEQQVEKPVYIIPMLKNDFIAVLLLGGATGLLVWILGTLLNRYVFDVYFCQGDINSQCAAAKNYAVAAASVLGGIAALGGLIRLRVYRPLLVVIAVLISTWGIVQSSWSLGWFTGILAVIILYALAFGAFSWIARVREFWIALVAIVLLVVAVRLAITL